MEAKFTMSPRFNCMIKEYDIAAAEAAAGAVAAVGGERGQQEVKFLHVMRQRHATDGNFSTSLWLDAQRLVDSNIRPLQ